MKIINVKQILGSKIWNYSIATHDTKSDFEQKFLQQNKKLPNQIKF